MAWRLAQRFRAKTSIVGRAGNADAVEAPPSPPKEEETKTEVAVELPPPRKLAPRVPTPDPSKPFAAGGFQAFKRKWQAKQ